jgi:hypothetical protein
VVERPRHRQGHHPKRPAVLVAHAAEPLQVLLERLVVFVSRVLLDDGDHRLGVHEPGEVVHVAVGVVARDPVAQPEDMADPDIVAQVALDRLAVQGRVALGSGGTPVVRRAASVDVDGSAP